jgi:hypothetical protein
VKSAWAPAIIERFDHPLLVPPVRRGGSPRSDCGTGARRSRRSIQWSRVGLDDPAAWAHVARSCLRRKLTWFARRALVRSLLVPGKGSSLPVGGVQHGTLLTGQIPVRSVRHFWPCDSRATSWPALLRQRPGRCSNTGPGQETHCEGVDPDAQANPGLWPLTPTDQLSVEMVQASKPRTQP